MVTEMIIMKKYIKKYVKKVIKAENLKTFRLSGKHLFLTYSKINVKKENVLKQLEEFFGQNMEKYLISEEEHDDGEKHIHVYIKLKIRCDIKGWKKLDIVDDEGEKKHGNYQTCRSFKKVIPYVSKNKNILTNMNLDDNGREINIWKELYEKAKKQEMALTIADIAEASPRVALLDFKKIKNSLEELRRYNKKTEVKVYDIESFHKIEELKNYEEKMGEKTLYLSGDTGSGKTEFIKAFYDKKLGGIGNVLRITNKEGLSKLAEKEYKGLILDDVDLREFTGEELLNLTDVKNNANQRVLYKNVEIEAGMPRAILTNKSFEEAFSGIPIRQLEALIRRCINIDLRGKKLIIRLEMEIKEDK